MWSTLCRRDFAHCLPHAGAWHPAGGLGLLHGAGGVTGRKTAWADKDPVGPDHIFVQNADARADESDDLGLWRQESWARRFKRLHAVFNARRLSWTQPVAWRRGSILGARQGAAGAVVWGRLVVFGGWDRAGNICSDAHMLVLDTAGARWSPLQMEGESTVRGVYGSTLTQFRAADGVESALLCGGLLFGGYRGACNQCAELRQEPLADAGAGQQRHSHAPSAQVVPEPAGLAEEGGMVDRDAADGDVSVVQHADILERLEAGGSRRNTGREGGEAHDTRVPSLRQGFPPRRGSRHRCPSVHRYRWTQPAEDGEGWGCTPRAYHSTTFVPDHGRLVVFGGFAGGRPMTRLEVYDVARAQWVVAEATGREPAPRFGHSATAAGPCVVVAGGSTGGHNHKGLRTSGDELDDIWILSLLRPSAEPDPLAYVWSQVAVRGATPTRALQRCHSAVVAGNKLLFLFGGPSHQLNNDVAVFDLGTQSFAPNQPSVVGSEPCRRQGAVVAKLDARTAVVYGGWGGRELADVHFLRLLGPEVDSGDSGPVGTSGQGGVAYKLWNALKALNSGDLVSAQCVGGLVRSVLAVFGVAMVACMIAWCVRVYFW